MAKRKNSDNSNELGNNIMEMLQLKNNPNSDTVFNSCFNFRGCSSYEFYRKEYGIIELTLKDYFNIINFHSDKITAAYFQNCHFYPSSKAENSTLNNKLGFRGCVNCHKIYDRWGGGGKFRMTEENQSFIKQHKINILLSTSEIMEYYLGT